MNFLAIDLGASSGRHIVGTTTDGKKIETVEVHRFDGYAASENGRLYWDLGVLAREVEAGIKKAFENFGEIESLAIDTWGVDYVLMRGDEPILPCYAYRDERGEKAAAEMKDILSPREIYAETGIQYHPFNTVYQLYSDLKAGRLETATDFLMMPEYLSYYLTGVKKKEYTNATTGALVDVKTGGFSGKIIDRLGLPKRLFTPLSLPSTEVGKLRPEIAKRVGGDLTVVLCASHDTASAVEGVDMPKDGIYISSGTWSLMGVKAKSAVTDERSEKLGFTNEGGVGYIRYLKNITGMWIVQNLRRELCPDLDFGTIADRAKNCSTYSDFIDVDAPDFAAPVSMKAAIDGYLAAHGLPPAESTDDYFRCAYISLAEAYRIAVRDLEKATGKRGSIYIVGGGAKNLFLNELTEASTRKRVVAIPIEATAIGNLKIQIRRLYK